MINRRTFVLCIASAALCATSTAFAQTFEHFGPVLPMVFDGQGGSHYCMYGYYGPFSPPITPASDYTTVVCPRSFQRVPWLASAQKERSSAGKARAQANAKNKLSH